MTHTDSHAMFTPRAPLSWQAIAFELLRRLAGVPPGISTEQLRAAGVEHELALFERSFDSLYFAVCDPEHPRQRLYRALWTAQLRETRAVVDELARSGVTAIAFKGIEIGARYRPAHGIGVCSDVDLLLPVGELWSAERILYGRGYAHREYVSPAHGWRDAPPIDAFRRQAIGYELIPFVKAIELEGLDQAALAEGERFPTMFSMRDNAALAYVYFDIHHNIWFNLDVAPLWRRAVPSALGTGRTLCAADHLWFLIQRYYFEVATGTQVKPRVLAPIAAVSSDPAVDWELFVRIAIDGKAAAPCWYWLSFFHRLGAPGISEQVLAQLRPHCHRSERNWGWQLARLLDVDDKFPDELLAASAPHAAQVAAR